MAETSDFENIRYWHGKDGSPWDSPLNWSSDPEFTIDRTVPGPNDLAVFDRSATVAAMPTDPARWPTIQTMGCWNVVKLVGWHDDPQSLATGFDESFRERILVHPDGLVALRVYESDDFRCETTANPFKFDVFGKRVDFFSPIARVSSWGEEIQAFGKKRRKIWFDLTGSIGNLLEIDWGDGGLDRRHLGLGFDVDRPYRLSHVYFGNDIEYRIRVSLIGGHDYPDSLFYKLVLGTPPDFSGLCKCQIINLKDVMVF